MLLAHLFELEVMDLNFEAAARMQSFSELLGQENGAVLAAGAAERDHQTLESAELIIIYAGIHKRIDRGEELVNAFLLIQILDHRRVLAGQVAEALFSSWIRQASAVKNEAATVSAVVAGHFAME